MQLVSIGKVNENGSKDALRSYFSLGVQSFISIVVFLPSGVNDHHLCGGTVIFAAFCELFPYPHMNSAYLLCWLL